MNINSQRMAEPNLRYFRKIARELGLSDVRIEDVSSDYGILALQGPHSVTVLQQLTDEATSLRYFRLNQTIIVGKSVTIFTHWVHGGFGLRIVDSC